MASEKWALSGIFESFQENQVPAESRGRARSGSHVLSVPGIHKVSLPCKVPGCISGKINFQTFLLQKTNNCLMILSMNRASFHPLLVLFLLLAFAVASLTFQPCLALDCQGSASAQLQDQCGDDCVAVCDFTAPRLFSPPAANIVRETAPPLKLFSPSNIFNPPKSL